MWLKNLQMITKIIWSMGSDQIQIYMDCLCISNPDLLFAVEIKLAKEGLNTFQFPSRTKMEITSNSEILPKNSAKESDPFNVNYWNDRWTNENTSWHKNSFHPALLKYISLVTGQSLTSEPLSISDPVQFNENSKKTWFLPLCGKTMDITYLLSQGFRVFAVEAVKMAIDCISEEQSISFDYDEDRKVYSGADGRLQIYCGDFFTCPMEQFGPVDYVFDRGSFIAVEYEFREKYIEAMQRALRMANGSWHKFQYVLESVVYDKSKFGGPPRCVDDADIETYFKAWANVELLEATDVPEGHSLIAKCGTAISRCFLVTPQM